MNQHTTTAIYLRSHEGPDGRSLERQRLACLGLLDRLGWQAEEVYMDNGPTSRRRPSFERMLEDVAAGRVQRIVTHDPDRLYRRLAELDRFLELVEDHGLEVRTVTSGGLDLASASGRLAARLVGALARHEAELEAQERSERARAASAARKEARR